MKKLTLLFIILITIEALIYAQDFGNSFVHDFGSSDWETIAATVLDDQGNAYISGSFTGTLQIGSFSKTSNGKRDVFLAKIDKDGTVLWLENYGGAYDDNVYSIIEDNGTIYLTGSFKKETTLGTIPLSAIGFTDLFFAEIDANRIVTKAVAIISSSTAQKAFLQKNVAGEIIIAGTFKKDITINGNLINASGKTDIYYATYDRTLNSFKNETSFGGTDEDWLLDFKVSPADEFYFAGSFKTDFTSGSTTFTTTNKKTDAFFVKIDNTGQTILAKQYGGVYNDQLKRIALDAENNIYLAGEYEHAVTIGTANYSTTKKRDAFLVRLAPNGDINWSTRLGTGAYNTISSLEIGGTDKFYVTGGFRGTLGTEASARNSKDAYVALYQQATGTQDWLIKAGHNHEDNLQLKRYPTGELFISGFFSNAFELQTIDIKDKNYKDLYVAKLVDCGAEPGIELGGPQAACNSLDLSVANDFASYLWSTSSITNTATINQTELVSLTVTDNYGCIFTDEVNVTIDNDLIIDLGLDQTFCEGNSIVLTAGPVDRNYLWNDGITENSRTITESGTYSVVLNEQNCIASDEVVVTVHPTPLVDLGPDVSAAIEETIYLRAGPGFQSYLWVSGHTDSILTVPMHYIDSEGGSADIWVHVTDQNGCLGGDTVFVQVIYLPATAENGENNVTNLEELSKNTINTSQVYPNPTTGKFYVSVDDSGKVKLVDIYDLRGNHIKTFQKNLSFPLEIELTGEAKGMYVIKISYEKSAEDLRIIYE